MGDRSSAVAEALVRAEQSHDFPYAQNPTIRNDSDDEIEVVVIDSAPNDFAFLKSSIWETQPPDDEGFLDLGEEEEWEEEYNRTEKTLSEKEGLEGLIQLFPLYTWVEYFVTLLLFLVILLVYNANHLSWFQSLWV